MYCRAKIASILPGTYEKNYTHCNIDFMQDWTARTSSPVGDLSSTDKNSVGGGCEGCDLMFVEIPSTIKSNVTIISTTESGEKLEISGVIYQSDGKTPAPDVILYVYQTAKKRPLRTWS